MPTFDQLNISLSRRVDDPVAAAATDGPRFSSAMRIDWLNEAIRRWILKQVRIVPGTLQAYPVDEIALQNYIKQDSVAMVANVKPLSSGWAAAVAWIIDAYDTTLSLPINPLQSPNDRYQYDTGGNSYLLASTTNLFWTTSGGNFELLGGGATDTIKLKYICQHTDLAAAGTILVPANYHNQIIDLALQFFGEEYPQDETAARLALKFQAANVEDQKLLSGQ